MPWRGYALRLLLLCITLIGLSNLEASAQRRRDQERIPLREYSTDRAFDYSAKSKPYFFDEKGDLDKFVGTWEGTSWNGYSIKANLILVRKYSFSDLYDIDLLALDLQVMKDGKVIPTGLILDDRFHRVRGKRLSSRVKPSETDAVARRYILVLRYGNDLEGKYSGSCLTQWEINEAEDEILVWPGGGVTIEGRYRIPDYARGKKMSQPQWRLHRVK